MAAGISPGGRPIDESPLSTSKTDNWVARNGGLPPYVRGIARGIAKKHGGKVTSGDIAMAWQFVKKLAATSKNPAVKAAAGKAVAQETVLRAKAHGKSHSLARYVFDVIDLDWSAYDAARPKGVKAPKLGAQPVAPTGTVAGYTGPAMSPQTIAAIKQFQQQNGLPVTGNLDANTVTYAKQYPAKVAAAAAAKKATAAATTAANKKTAADKKAAAAKTKAAKTAATAKTKAAKAAATAAKQKTTAATKAQKQTAKEKVNSIKVQIATLKAAGKTKAANALAVPLATAQATYSNLAKYGTEYVDLAAQDGHHISGTSYHWHHGWVPRDRATASRYGKKFSTTSAFHNVEPEEFNGYDGMPKHVGSTKFGGTDFGDGKPVMKYKANKHLTGQTFKDSKGNTVKVDKVSQSGTHVTGEDGKKTRISELKPTGAASATALQNYNKKKYSAATKTYSIKSSYKKSPAAKPIPNKYSKPEKETAPSWSATPVGKTYSADPAHYDEPTFPRTSPLMAPNTGENKLTSNERNQLIKYTGSSYADLNDGLRKGKISEDDPRVKNMDTALKKAAPLPGSPTLHRGFSVQALQQLQPGDSFVDKAYVSTSRKSDLHLAARSTRLHIESTSPDLKKLDVNGISLHPNEHEVILPRNTKFQVLRRVEHGSHVHLYVHASPASAEDLNTTTKAKDVKS